MEDDKIVIPVHCGYIIAERNPDNDYDGISVYFRDNNGNEIDLVMIEAKEEFNRKQIDVYSYENIYLESYTRKLSIHIDDILQMEMF